MGRGAGEWLEWFLSDRGHRAAGPGADWTVEEVRVREEAEANWGRVSGARLVEQLVGIEPTNGRLLAQAARVALEEYVRRQDSRVLREAGWLSGRAVDLAPGHAAVWWAYASWLEHAGDVAGTLRAMEQAERLPGVSSRLLLGKAQRYEAEWRENRMEADRVLAAYQAAIDGVRGGAKLGRNELRLAWLACTRIHAQAGNREAVRMARRQAYGLDMPPRDPQMPSRLIDLSDYYTAGLDTDWRESRFAGYDLSGLPRGRQVMAGVEYDVRGLVQLSSELLEVRRLHFPRAVEGIPVGQRCARLHFLHAADAVVDLGETVARYTIHLGDGGDEMIVIRYGNEAWPWDWEPGGELAKAAVWRGSSRVGLPVWLYRTTWTNAQPDVPVVSVDLTSTMTWCGVFVVAITAE